MAPPVVVAAAGSIPKGDIERMKAAYPSVYLPRWLPPGYIYLNWSGTHSYMNKTSNYDGIEVEFAHAGQTVTWSVGTGSCTSGNVLAILPFSKLLSKWRAWAKEKGPTFTLPPANTGAAAFYGVLAYTALGNHTQDAWACFGRFRVDVNYSDGGMLAAANWMRAAASAQPAG